MTEKMNILFVYSAMIPSVYLCGYVQLEHLQKSGAANFRSRVVRAVSREDVLWADIVMLVRLDSFADEWLARQCRRAGKYLIYVMDDDLLNIPEYISSYPFYAYEETRRRIKNIIGSCQGFASPSEELMQKYARSRADCISIIEPATALLAERPAHDDGKVRIGFAGSTDRGRDIDDILSGAIRQIVEKYSDRVSVELLGPETEISRQLGLKTYPYMDSYSDYQALMKELNWDIGLAPMPDTPFHRCKHYNKLVEYSGFGIAGVYSDVVPYSGAVENGVTGLLCENSQQAWTEAISRLIDDGELRARIRQNCLEKAAGEFSVPHAAGELYRQLERVHADARPGKRLALFRLGMLAARGMGLFKRCIYAIKNKRVKTYILKKLRLTRHIHA